MKLIRLQSRSRAGVPARTLLFLGLIAGPLAACSGDLGSWASLGGNWDVFPKSNTGSVRNLGADALVSADGRCADAPAADAAPPGGEPPAVPASRGVTLDMSECDLVRLNGPVDRVELGTNERGERTAVLTYSQGARAGIYRFVSGRLVTIERAGEPLAAPKPAKKKKPANKKDAPPT